MVIREIPIADITPAAYNPRKDLKPGDPEYEKLYRVMDHYDLVEPLVWNQRTGNLVGGHQRLKILKARGDQTVPAVILDLDETEEKALNVALNKVQGDWDLPLLRDLLQDLKSLEFDLDLTGFSIEEFDTLLAPAMIGRIDEDTIPEQASRPASRSGDLWLLDRHRLLVGDATNPRDVERLFHGAVPNLMVSDPPYGVEYDPEWRNRAFGEANRSTGAVQNDHRADWGEAWALFPGSIAFVWHAGTKAHTVAEGLLAAGFEIRSQIIWVKPHFVISRGAYHVQHEPCFYAVRQGATGNWQGDRKQTTVWEIGNGLSQSGPRQPEDAPTIHATQKPVECMRRPIVNHTQVGDGVYDPFCGSGTTIIAAETCRRIGYGLEINALYVDVAIQRWERFTGKKAVLDGDGRTFPEIAKDRQAQNR